MVDAIATALGSRDLQTSMVAYGIKRVQDFSFQPLANSLHLIYEQTK